MDSKVIKSKMCQNLILELSDGRIIYATVPAFCKVGDQVSVKEIRVTNPKKLPDGCNFEQVGYSKGEKNESGG